MDKQTGMETLVQMSRLELERKRLLERILDRLMRQKDAAKEMGMSTRHVRRLLLRYGEQGPMGLVSRPFRVGADMRLHFFRLLRPRRTSLATRSMAIIKATTSRPMVKANQIMGIEAGAM